MSMFAEQPVNLETEIARSPALQHLQHAGYELQKVKPIEIEHTTYQIHASKQVGLGTVEVFLSPDRNPDYTAASFVVRNANYQRHNHDFELGEIKMNLAQAEEVASGL